MKNSRLPLILVLAVSLESVAALGWVNPTAQPPSGRDPAAATMKTPDVRSVVQPPRTHQPSDPTTIAVSISSSGSHATALASASTYTIDWYSINGGGATDVSSASYKMGSSVGQSAAGEATFASYKMGIGFWYGAGSSGCTCTCHADPKCDGVTDVLDVVGAVNVAFRGQPQQNDPGCPKAREDIDCTGSIDILDVVHMVNVAFRGGNPATEFCNACP